MRSILQLRNKLKKTKNINKIIISEKEIKKAKEIKIKTKETKIEAKTTKTNIEADAKTNAKAITTTATITTNKKHLLKLRK